MHAMNRRIARQSGWLAALLLAAGAAIPQQSTGRYTVEIVVFRTAGQAGAMAGTVAVEPDRDDGVEPTAVSGRRLVTAANRLKGTSGYRVLAHTAWTQMPSAWRSGRGVPAARLGLTRAGINGRITLERGSSLHLGVDLIIEDGGRRYHISEMRQSIKADQPQYFDHPAIGVIAVVSAGG